MANIPGTANSETLNGTPDDDTIFGFEGNDRISGLGGNDFLDGGTGSDTILGGEGNDTINSIDQPSNIFAGVVAPERDIVDAGIGDDSVTGGRLDQLDGGAGNDFLTLNFGFAGPNVPAPVVITTDGDTITADDGTSIRGFEFLNFNLTNGDDVASTGNVRASITAGLGNDVIITGSGDDQLFGEGGNDVLSAGGGNDFLSGGDGNDRLTGGAGADEASVNAQRDGADTVDLGTGSDTVRVFGDVGFTGQVRLTFTSAEVGNGTAFDANTLPGQDGGLGVRFQLEDAAGNLTGPISRYDDEGVTFIQGQQGLTFDVRDISGIQRGDQCVGVVLGTDGADDLSFFPPFRANDPYYYNAGAGNDTITAGDNADFLVGGTGNDTLMGGAGTDTLLGGGDNDTLDGGDDNDVLDGGAGNDILRGRAGDDDLTGGAGNDRLGGGFGNDTLRGGLDQDQLFGNEGNDILFGETGNDQLEGQSGNDLLFGGDGNDALRGGAGSDILTGGLGNDAFVFNSTLRGGDIDTITDFANTVGNNDFIQLENRIFTALTSTGELAASLFAANASGLAGDADDRIVYNTSNGNLFYDADGNGSGAAVQFATLSSQPALTAADIFVI